MKESSPAHRGPSSIRNRTSATGGNGPSTGRKQGSAPADAGR
ncbi:Hypothetical protein SCLAV_5008 [Streptomyces clavuligerus]|uniref:Uncharacterized protein n=1 Tax=Streptomyces clavuligerus TaxID=1901 RepID=E2PX04_STRCL|nr:Hypothetical protein SCLAV_5008 [Streptomyces clavuligerus]